MTWYEAAWLLAEPFLPVLPGKVRRDLRQVIGDSQGLLPELLDVGGRKSPYTIGLPVHVTLLDLPRNTDTQIRLNLGLTAAMVEQLYRRRSNIRSVILQDMTQCSLPAYSFDGLVCVEVIEHVAGDDEFMAHAARLIRPGGFLYLTTPNGDYVRNEQPHYNPDHVRHYSRRQLTQLLERHFNDVKVAYGIKTGKYRVRGLSSLDLRNPIRLLESAACNLISHWESSGLEEQPRRTAHLFALARKRHLS